jgi:hypothetical protein
VRVQGVGVSVMVRARSKISVSCRQGFHESCDGIAYVTKGPFMVFEIKCRCPCHEPVKLDQFAGGVNEG